MLEIKLKWESKLYNNYNLDSIAVYNNKIYITCKSKNTILVLNLKGIFIRFIGKDLFNRPNGILILDNFMFITVFFSSKSFFIKGIILTLLLYFKILFLQTSYANCCP